MNTSVHGFDWQQLSNQWLCCWNMTRWRLQTQVFLQRCQKKDEENAEREQNMWFRSRIYRRGENNFSFTNKVPSTPTTHKTVRFLKGVWFFLSRGQRSRPAVQLMHRPVQPIIHSVSLSLSSHTGGDMKWKRHETDRFQTEWFTLQQLNIGLSAA